MAWDVSLQCHKPHIPDRFLKIFWLFFKGNLFLSLGDDHLKGELLIDDLIAWISLDFAEQPLLEDDFWTVLEMEIVNHIAMYC